MNFLDALRSVFKAITDVIAYFTGRSAATKEAEQREEKARAAQEQVSSMSDAAIRDELRKYARTEEGGGGTDADKNS